MNHLTITKSDGTVQAFEEGKLINSLKRVGTAPELIEDIVEHVEKEMYQGIKTEDIYHRAFGLLKEHSPHMAVKYSIRRGMMEFGPDGFPFEKFVARIFRQWGYESLTDQVVPGSCVEHEVDVVAWKDESLAMAEVKYHNESGTKSDLKVVLYVKARFDDISDNIYDYGNKKRKLTERWLVTNTKFTEKAITYSECKDLKLIGWNYPATGSLHEIISDNGLQPITCLSSLSRDRKKDLIGRNVLTCVDIVGRPAILDEIGLHTSEHERVIGEAQMIIQEAK